MIPVAFHTATIVQVAPRHRAQWSGGTVTLRPTPVLATVVLGDEVYIGRSDKGFFAVQKAGA